MLRRTSDLQILLCTWCLSQNDQRESHEFPHNLPRTLGVFEGSASTPSPFPLSPAILEVSPPLRSFVPRLTADDSLLGTVVVRCQAQSSIENAGKYLALCSMETIASDRVDLLLETPGSRKAKHIFINPLSFL